MRILVTGAAGFIGSHIADRLTGRGHRVVGVDNYLTGRPENVGLWACYEGSIVDRGFFYGVANEVKPDLIIHCAVSYSDPNLWHRDTDTNTAGCINAAFSAKYHHARLVYFQTALPPISSYAISKIAGEQYIALSKVPSLIFRLANIYGPRNLSGPIPTFYKRLTAGEPCTVTDTRRDTVFVQDLVDLVDRAIGTDVTGKFDVCSGEHYPILDYYWHVAYAIGGTFPGKPPEPEPAAADDVAQMELDPALAATMFGWRATTPLEDGITRTVAWYEEHGVNDTYTHLRIKETV